MAPTNDSEELGYDPAVCGDGYICKTVQYSNAKKYYQKYISRTGRGRVLFKNIVQHLSSTFCDLVLGFSHLWIPYLIFFLETFLKFVIRESLMDV